MTAEWTSFCKGARDLRVDGERIEVLFTQGRHHMLTVEDAGEAYRLIGIVAKASVTAGVSDLALHVWRRNRATILAGFRLDPRGRLLGESLVPKPGLSAGEFQQWVRIVAAECDRFELALTGKDVE
ncbi:MAG: YbjN domain-containing protein [Polyangiaceae bacterium]